MWEWLEDDLSKNTDAAFTVLTYHPSPIAYGYLEGSHFRGHTFAKLSQIAQEYGINVVFSGHQHQYEASSQV